MPSDGVIPVKQTKFNAGEVSPQMYGDTLWPKYPAALKTCLNWLPIPEGALVKRPGTAFIAPVKPITGIGVTYPQVRLIPFIFSDGTAYVLEFGHLYIRFYQTGKFINTAYNPAVYGYGGTYYELTTPYDQATLAYLKYAQAGNTITITYGGQVSGFPALSPMDLTKTANANGPWTLANTVFTPPNNTTAGPTNAISSWINGTVYAIGTQVYGINAGVGVLWTCINAHTAATATNSPPGTTGGPQPTLTINGAGTGLAGNLWWTPSVDTAHPAQTWNLTATAVIQNNATGVTIETIMSGVTVVNVPLSVDRVMPVIIAAFVLTGYTVLYYNYYRGSNGIFGFVSQVTVAQATGGFYDTGIAPDYTRQPPIPPGNPFIVNGANHYPAITGYMDQRRVFADLDILPNEIITSVAGNLYRYDQPVPGADTDSTRLLLNSEFLEQIRAFVTLKCNVVFTGKGEWVFPDEAYTRSSTGPRKHSMWGSSWLDPIRIGNGCLFNTAQGNQVRDFFPLYGLYTSIWDGENLTTQARHFFEHHKITSWAYQNIQYPILWMVRDDGILLSLTYQRATQDVPGVTAWAQHYTGAGIQDPSTSAVGVGDIVESVCVVPEPPDDILYLVTRRVDISGTVFRSVERMPSLVPPTAPAGITGYTYNGQYDQRYAIYTDCSVTYDGHNNTTSTVIIDSYVNPGSSNPSDYVLGAQVKMTITPMGTAAPAFTNTDPDTANVVFNPESPATPASSRTPFTVKITGYLSTTVAVGELQSSLTSAQVLAWNAGSGGGLTFGVARSLFLVNHLNGYPADSGGATGARGVSALVDGQAAEASTSTFVAGSLVLAEPGLVVIIGIRYNADVALLDVVLPNAEIRNKYKDVTRVGFEVANSRGLNVGQDFQSLVPWSQRDVSNSYTIMGLQTGYFSEFIPGNWTTSGSVVLRSFEQLPGILVSALRELALGGD